MGRHYTRHVAGKHHHVGGAFKEGANSGGPRVRRRDQHPVLKQHFAAKPFSTTDAMVFFCSTWRV
jgi:hypothetical protein